MTATIANTAPLTNLLAMPLVLITVETGTNEDWVDSILFLVDTGVPDELKPQLDIRDIKFEMEVRRSASDHQVIISASTEDGSLLIGEEPDFGYLIINVDVKDMRPQQPGSYIADIVGTDAVSSRVVVQIDLTLVEGITR
jgi:hypothetical protein